MVIPVCGLRDALYNHDPRPAGAEDSSSREPRPIGSHIDHESGHIAQQIYWHGPWSGRLVNRARQRLPNSTMLWFKPAPLNGHFHPFL